MTLETGRINHVLGLGENVRGEFFIFGRHGFVSEELGERIDLGSQCGAAAHQGAALEKSPASHAR